MLNIVFLCIIYIYIYINKRDGLSCVVLGFVIRVFVSFRCLVLVSSCVFQHVSHTFLFDGLYSHTCCLFCHAFCFSSMMIRVRLCFFMCCIILFWFSIDFVLLASASFVFAFWLYKHKWTQNMKKSHFGCLGTLPTQNDFCSVENTWFSTSRMLKAMTN